MLLSLAGLAIMHLKIVCCRRTEPLCAVMHARLSRRFLAELWRETKRIFMSDPDQVVDQDKPDRRIVVTALGVTQILAWGSTFYLLGVLANPIARDTGWDYDWVISGVSAGLLMAGV